MRNLIEAVTGTVILGRDTSSQNIAVAARTPLVTLDVTALDQRQLDQFETVAGSLCSSTTTIVMDQLRALGGDAHLLHVIDATFPALQSIAGSAYFTFTTNGRFPLLRSIGHHAHLHSMRRHELPRLRTVGGDVHLEIVTTATSRSCERSEAISLLKP